MALRILEGTNYHKGLSEERKRSVKQIPATKSPNHYYESRITMDLTIISTPDAPAPGGAYSQAIGAGDFIYTSGQVGVNPQTGQTPADFREQTRQALNNLGAVLRASGAELTDVVKTTCFLTDITMFNAFNEEYSAFFGDHRPARSTFGVALAGGFAVEVEAVAHLLPRH